MGAKHTRSNNTGYEILPVSPAVDWLGGYAGLTRREMSRAFIARFHTKYQKTDGCWLWQAGKYRKGYGMVCIGRTLDGKQQNSYAHRVAYVLAHGDIPPGLVVMHSCDVRYCVNPAHLSLGTQGDNIRDGARRGRYNVGRPSKRLLTDAQVEHVRTSPERVVVLAEQFGVTPQYIWLVRRRLRRAA